PGALDTPCAGNGSLQSQLRGRRHQRRRAGSLPALHASKPQPDTLSHAGQRDLHLLVVDATGRRRAWHVRILCRAGGAARLGALLTTHILIHELDALTSSSKCASIKTTG